MSTATDVRPAEAAGGDDIEGAAGPPRGGGDDGPARFRRRHQQGSRGRGRGGPDPPSPGGGGGGPGAASPPKEPAGGRRAPDHADGPKHVSLDKNYATDYRPHTTNYKAATTCAAASHRSYVSFSPTCNKLLAKKWDEHNRQLHLQKLRRTKPTVDNRPPKVHKHLETNVRKIQNEEARQAEIERKNSILVEKMADIMKTTANEYDYRKRLEPDPEYLQMLHMARRQRDLNIINKQNLAMLVRLEGRESNYSHEQWENDRNRNLYYLRNIASFPRKYVEEAERLWKGQGPRLSSAGEGSASASAPAAPQKVEKLPLINGQKPPPPPPPPPGGGGGDAERSGSERVEYRGRGHPAAAAAKKHLQAEAPAKEGKSSQRGTPPAAAAAAERADDRPPPRPEQADDRRPPPTNGGGEEENEAAAEEEERHYVGGGDALESAGPESAPRNSPDDDGDGGGALDGGGGEEEEAEHDAAAPAARAQVSFSDELPEVET